MIVEEHTLGLHTFKRVRPSRKTRLLRFLRYIHLMGVRPYCVDSMDIALEAGRSYRLTH